MEIAIKILDKLWDTGSLGFDSDELVVTYNQLREAVEAAYIEGLLEQPWDWLTIEWEDEKYPTTRDALTRLYSLKDKYIKNKKPKTK